MIFLINPLSVVCGTVGLTFIIAALLSRRYPPKKINSLYGYRTKSSMKSDAQWQFAQTYSNELMLKYGLILAAIGILGGFIPIPDLYAAILSTTIMIALIYMLFQKTESAIKNQFED